MTWTQCRFYVNKRGGEWYSVAMGLEGEDCGQGWHFFGQCFTGEAFSDSTLQKFVRKYIMIVTVLKADNGCHRQQSTSSTILT